MPDWPIPRMPPLNVITPFHPEALGTTMPAFQRTIALGGTASAVTVANQAYFYPFRVFEPATAVKMSYLVGGVQNGNADVGIYDWEKNLLVNSGSTAQGAINTLQEIDITDTVLTPGQYFMAIQLSSGTGTAFSITASDEVLLPAMAMYEQAVGSFGLPTTAAFAMSTAGSLLMIAMGVHFDTLI